MLCLMCLGGGLDVSAALVEMLPPGGGRPDVDVLACWAEGLRPGRTGVPGHGCLRFAFYGRVSTEDWQDPVTSRARAAAAGDDAHSRARGDRCRVLRHRAEPGPGVGAAPAGSRAGCAAG